MTRIKKLIVEGALSSFCRFNKFKEVILLRLIKPIRFQKPYRFELINLNRLSANANK